MLICFASVECVFTQDFSWVMDDDKQYEIPIGKGDYEQLKDGDFYSEMEEHYLTYAVDSETVSRIDRLGESHFADKKLEITIVFGAWCGDSREHLPHFYKIIEESHFLSHTHIDLIGCDRDKMAGDLNIQLLEISFVPTFVFIVDGVEIGRIVEAPEITLEDDIMRLLSEI